MRLPYAGEWSFLRRVHLSPRSLCMSNNFSYADAHVFVAGGTSGINLGIAQAFARAGARVSVLSRSQDKIDAR